MFGFKHTMNNLDHNRIDHKVDLEGLYPYLLVRFNYAFYEELQHGRAENGEMTLSMAHICRKLSSRMMSLIFFGDKLTSNEKFSAALLQYSRDMINCMMAFQVTPGFLSPIVHFIITKRGRAMHILQSHFYDIMGPGRENWDEPEAIKPYTIIHNMTNLGSSSRYWDGADVKSQNLLGVWFAASHQPWMNLHFILLELCAQPDWQVRLRQELEGCGDFLDYDNLRNLPFLDSLIKETLRLNPLDTLGVRRKAVEAYTFTDGSVTVPRGATICVPAGDILHDAQIYAQPDQFEGTRFLPKSTQSRPSRFTDVSHEYPMWGYGSLACPGRFHAELVIKMVLSQLLLKYDMRLLNGNARKNGHGKLSRFRMSQLE
ncbi:cytochrome P450 [Massariosphaeria phaeospora]|uniref:Cytochrome P450 n=1 Tax=Massariosphaeria phaeospora TaxID=100035 RepID=A0A7C8IEX0_9PLEO|nr:cytochrome P450 [Massariosphaeria phaeospora]